MKRRDFLKGAGGLVVACSLGFSLDKLTRIMAPSAADNADGRKMRSRIFHLPDCKN